VPDLDKGNAFTVILSLGEPWFSCTSPSTHQPIPELVEGRTCRKVLRNGKENTHHFLRSQISIKSIHIAFIVPFYTFSCRYTNSALLLQGKEPSRAVKGVAFAGKKIDLKAG